MQPIIQSGSLLEAFHWQLEKKLFRSTRLAVGWVSQSVSQSVSESVSQSASVSQYETVRGATSDQLVTLTVSRPGRASQARNRPEGG